MQIDEQLESMYLDRDADGVITGHVDEAMTLTQFTNLLMARCLLKSDATPTLRLISKRSCQGPVGRMHTQFWYGYASKLVQSLFTKGAGTLTKKGGNFFRVGIFLDFVWLTTRTMHPHGAYVRGARRNRIVRHGGEIERPGLQAPRSSRPGASAP